MVKSGLHRLPAGLTPAVELVLAKARYSVPLAEQPARASHNASAGGGGRGYTWSLHIVRYSPQRPVMATILLERSFWMGT